MRTPLTERAFCRRMGGAGLRRGLRGGGGGAPNVVMYGINGFTNAAGYQTANGGGEQGSASGFVVAELVSIDDQGVASKDRWLAGVNDGTAPTAGWQLITRTSNSTIRFGMRQTGGGSLTSTSEFTVGPSLVGTVLHVCVVVDVTAQTMSLYIDGVLTHTATAITAYAVPDTSVPDSIGRLSVGASGADGTTFYGRASGHGVMSQAEVAAHRAACLAVGDIVELSGADITATHTYSVKAAVIAAGSTASAPATIADTTGSSDMSRAGTPTLRIRTNPPWV